MALFGFKFRGLQEPRAESGGGVAVAALGLVGGDDSRFFIF
jgi:hypothetical protein